jgi:hypothetical protein
MRKAEGRKQKAERRMRNKIHWILVTAYHFLHSAYWLVMLPSEKGGGDDARIQGLKSLSVGL